MIDLIQKHIVAAIMIKSVMWQWDDGRSRWGPGDIVRLSGEDLGTQLAPMISPRLFKSWSGRAPACESARESSRRKPVWCSCPPCGNVRPFIPTWIEMGLDT
jgi:hypothetical protein